MIGLIGELPGLQETPEGQQLARELQRRICLSATISNALFGFTEVPGSMAERLRLLAGAMVDLMGAANQIIRVGVLVRGTCPDHLRMTVMRTAHELIGNAVKHGMKGRPGGRISVRDGAMTRAPHSQSWTTDGASAGGRGKVRVWPWPAASRRSMAARCGSKAMTAPPPRWSRRTGADRRRDQPKSDCDHVDTCMQPIRQLTTDDFTASSMTSAGLPPGRGSVLVPGLAPRRFDPLAPGGRSRTGNQRSGHATGRNYREPDRRSEPSPTYL